MTSDEDEFELWYRAFMDALEIMVDTAENQCRIMGYYNVAWEIMDDVVRGADLLVVANKTCGKLPLVKQNAISNFLNKINGIVPEELLVFTDTEDANINAMRQSCWIPIRKYAAELIRTMNS